MMLLNDPCYSKEELRTLNQSKGEIFENCEFTVDYALPQNWLDDFSKFNPAINYDLIRSTCCWAYPKDKFSGIPITCCVEVYNMYKRYVTFLENK